MIDANRLASGIVRVDDGRGFYHGLEELECCAQCDTANGGRSRRREAESKK
jgi:hypothetical protein